jgi:hypothetical protein
LFELFAWSRRIRSRLDDRLVWVLAELFDDRLHGYIDNMGETTGTPVNGLQFIQGSDTYRI